MQSIHRRQVSVTWRLWRSDARESRRAINLPQKHAQLCEHLRVLECQDDGIELD